MYEAGRLTIYLYMCISSKGRASLASYIYVNIHMNLDASCIYVNIHMNLDGPFPYQGYIYMYIHVLLHTYMYEATYMYHTYIDTYMYHTYISYIYV